MSRIQSAVRPTLSSLIIGQDVVPEPRFWDALVPWLMMTTITAEYIDPRWIVIGQADRTALLKHIDCGAPLETPGWSFGVSLYVGDSEENPLYRHYRQRIGYRKFSQSTTFRLGSIVLSAHSGTEQLPGLDDVLARSDFSQIMQLLGIGIPIVWPPKVFVIDYNIELVYRRIILALRSGLAEGLPSFKAAGNEIYQWMVDNGRRPALHPND